MAESIKRQIDQLEATKKTLEKAIPLIITPSRAEEGLRFVVEGAEKLQGLSFDDNFGKLATSMKILANGGSVVLSSIYFQSFILEILEMVASLLDQAKNEGLPQESRADELLNIGQFLVGVSGRVTHRYKLNVIFEPEYEAKSLRAFMVVKELSRVVRFLNLAPDISENQNANLDNGLEIDCLSQESPDELHRIAGSVLEVQNVQVFRETKPQPLPMLDPPAVSDSFDTKIADFLDK